MIVRQLRHQRVHDRVEDAVPPEEGQNWRGVDSLDPQHLVKVPDRKRPPEQEHARDKVETQHEAVAIPVGQRNKRNRHEEIYHPSI